MRFTTTLLSLTVLMAGCLADVGGDTCVGKRCKVSEGSGATPPKVCDDPEELVRDLTLRTASDFDALPDGCWALNGNLRLEGAGITSLAGLGELIEVNDLELVDTGLTSIDSRKAVQVWGSLVVSGNTRLTSLSTLAVKRWTGEVQAGAAWEVGYTIRNNPVLTSVDGLRYINRVDRDLRLTDNAQLATVDFNELAVVTGGVYVTGTAATSIRFPVLAQLGRIEVAGNARLTEVGAFAANATVGDVVLRANPALTTLEATRALTQLGGLTIDDNDALVDLAFATSSLQRLNGALTISNNAKLTGLGQLGRLTGGITASVSITGNPQLSSCAALEVDHCVQSGAVTLQNNLNATNCTCWCGL